MDYFSNLYYYLYSNILIYLSFNDLIQLTKVSKKIRDIVLNSKDVWNALEMNECVYAKQKFLALYTDNDLVYLSPVVKDVFNWNITPYSQAYVNVCLVTKIYDRSRTMFVRGTGINWHSLLFDHRIFLLDWHIINLGNMGIIGFFKNIIDYSFPEFLYEIMFNMSVYFTVLPDSGIQGISSLLFKIDSSKLHYFVQNGVFYLADDNFCSKMIFSNITNPSNKPILEEYFSKEDTQMIIEFFSLLTKN